jgi:hypothetical protein
MARRPPEFILISTPTRGCSRDPSRPPGAAFGQEGHLPSRTPLRQIALVNGQSVRFPRGIRPSPPIPIGGRRGAESGWLARQDTTSPIERCLVPRRENHSKPGLAAHHALVDFRGALKHKVQLRQNLAFQAHPLGRAFVECDNLKGRGSSKRGQVRVGPNCHAARPKVSSFLRAQDLSCCVSHQRPLGGTVMRPCPNKE